MDCYAYSTETYWLTVLYGLYEYSRKTCQFTVLYALLCTVKKNVSVHCVVCIVTHTQEKTKQKTMLAHCAVCIVMHIQEKKLKKKLKLKRVGSLCCIHCDAYSRKGGGGDVLVHCAVCILKKNILAHCAVCIVTYTQEKHVGS